jgi:hypothetical protein
LGKMTASMARNAVRRALRGVLDRYPTPATVAALWAHFYGCCAYCGDTLERELREGHADHLVATAAGGSNHPSNFVLACGRCNGDEKLDRDWESFLHLKCADEEPAVFTARRDRILEWSRQQGGAPPQPDAAAKARIEAQIASAIGAFNAAHSELLRIRGGEADPDRQPATTPPPTHS